MYCTVYCIDFRSTHLFSFTFPFLSTLILNSIFSVYYSRMVMWVEMSFLKSVHPANELTGGTDCCACGGGGPATAELTGKKSNMSNVKDVKDAKSGGAAAAVAAAHAKNERAKGPPPGSTPVPVVANKCCVPKGKNDKCFAEGSDAECCPRAIESKECCLEGDSCYSTPDPNAGTGEKGCCMGGQNQKDGACCVAPPPKKMAPKVVKTGAEEAEEDDDADDDATDSGLATAGKGDESRPPAGSGETAFDPKGDEMSTSAAHRVAGDVDSTEHPVAAVATVQTLPHATAAPQGLPSSLGVSSGSLNTSGTAHAPGSVTGRGPGGLTSDLSEISLTNGDVAPHTEASAAAAAGVTGAAAAPVTKPKKPTCSIQ